MRYDRLTVFHDRLKCPGAAPGGGRVHTDGTDQRLEMLAPRSKIAAWCWTERYVPCLRSGQPSHIRSLRAACIIGLRYMRYVVPFREVQSMTARLYSFGVLSCSLMAHVCTNHSVGSWHWVMNPCFLWSTCAYAGRMFALCLNAVLRRYSRLVRPNFNRPAQPFYYLARAYKIPVRHHLTFYQ